MGVIALRVGLGFVMLTEAEAEIPPPGAGVLTAALTTSAVTQALASRVTRSSVLLTYWVDTALPFQMICEAAANPVPVNTRAVAPLPTGTLNGTMLASVGTGLPTVKDSALDCPPPGVGVDTVRLATRAVRRSSVGM